MNSDTFFDFCVVGLGQHAQTKLIPAILNNKQNLRGVVSSKNSFNLSIRSQIFENLDKACSELKDDVCFIIATPPKFHFEAVNFLHRQKRNTLVEKPIFTSVLDAQKFTQFQRCPDFIIGEMFMHKHSRLYQKFLSDWKKHKATTSSIEIGFTIPSLPQKTFRDSRDLEDSIIFDIGCYPISTISDIGILSDRFSIINSNWQGGILQNLVLEFKNQMNLKIRIKIGVSESYSNYLFMKTFDGKYFRYGPFYYGRKGNRVVETWENNELKKRDIIEENDCFQNMLGVEKSFWNLGLSDQAIKTLDCIRVLDAIKSKMTQ